MPGIRKDIIKIGCEAADTGYVNQCPVRTASANAAIQALPSSNGPPGPGRFVDRHHDLHIAQPFFAGHPAGLLLQDASREVIHFDRELIGRAGIDRLPSLRMPLSPP